MKLQFLPVASSVGIPFSTIIYWDQNRHHAEADNCKPRKPINKENYTKKKRNLPYGLVN